MIGRKQDKLIKICKLLQIPHHWRKETVEYPHPSWTTRRTGKSFHPMEEKLAEVNFTPLHLRQKILKKMIRKDSLFEINHSALSELTSCSIFQQPLNEEGKSKVHPDGESIAVRNLRDMIRVFCLPFRKGRQICPGRALDAIQPAGWAFVPVGSPYPEEISGRFQFVFFRKNQWSTQAGFRKVDYPQSGMRWVNFDSVPDEDHKFLSQRRGWMTLP